MAYHPVTCGTLLDEIARRATGSSVGSLCSRGRDIGAGGDARWARLIGPITGGP